MNVWRISSRWSETGDSTSTILNIFWKHNIVFIYDEDHGLERVRSAQCDDGGDLLAVMDGQRIVGLAKALTEVLDFEEMNVALRHTDLSRFDGALHAIRGFRVSMIDISDEDIRHADRKRFCQIHQRDTIARLRTLWVDSKSEERGGEFQIEASTKTLRSLLQSTGERPVHLYQIPVYQRPYAWGEGEVERFLGDILRGVSKNEDMFIGTMQLSEKHLLSPAGPYGPYYYQQVIDGQQRLTTCALIMKALDLLAVSSEIQALVGNYDWIETSVSNGIQQRMLDEVLQAEELVEGNELNQYALNFLYILNSLRSLDSNVEEGELKVDLKDVYKFVSERLQFVVIETAAGLSKTLQIFNTINTAGLDLNGGDLFKVRAYEYFKDCHGIECFDQIAELYELIDRENRDIGRRGADINQILHIYQSILVGQNSLPVPTMRFASETFFARFFDVRLGVQRWENFSKVRELEVGNRKMILSLDTIKWVIEDRYLLCRYEAGDEELPLSVHFAFKIIEWGRYGEYWRLWHVFRCAYKDDPELLQLSGVFIQSISRLFAIYSVIYGKKVNHVHRFVVGLTRGMFVEEPSSIISKICDEIDLKRDELERRLGGEFAWVPTAKNLLCRMLEWFARDVDGRNLGALNRIFQGGYDIEHIQSYHDQSEADRGRIWKEWDSRINGLGNLMLLEFDINRSIGNKPFVEKIARYGGGGSSSRLAVPNAMHNAHNEELVWSVDDGVRKLKRDSEQLMEYLF